ncbi:glycosyltransferase family 90 protein [Auriscalpium vulgare]|uniref:Glycosyltransferase family 90 protein n=1 Tax=Auriscalpium vulgare TaxID=40419 RepID=A0ACB8RP20_9AGAM|nr:glycosyltransferase family 90 protein [Auriscalpium vulgare]
MSPDSSDAGWSPRRTYALVAAIAFVFLQAGLYTSRWQAEDNFSQSSVATSSIVSSPPPHVGTVAQHPIPQLMDEAERKFRALLSRQSRSLKAAVAEYTRRYGRRPPKGFDAWWKFVQENNVRLVDEYDGLVGDLEPYWNISAAEFRRRATQAAQMLPSVDLIRIRDGESEALNVKPNAEHDDVSMRARSFLLMIAKFQQTVRGQRALRHSYLTLHAQLPDMDFSINARSEGRVLVPWEQRKYPNISLQESFGEVVNSARTPDWRGRGSVWEAYRRTCAPDTPARRLFASNRASITNDSTNYLSTSPHLGAEFQFARDVDRRFAFCDSPSAHSQQGHFFSDWRTVPIPYPILSPAKTAGFSDIKIPSHYYYGTTRRYTYAWDEVNMELKELDSMETPWEQKSDKIFFRGATTGGGSSPPGFAQQYQRHRFVRMATDASNTTHTVVFADPPSSPNYLHTKVPASELNKEIMDVAFVSSVDHLNYPGGLAQQMEENRFDDAVLLRDHWANKYLLDLDGMSYSGKFFAFLASDSVVVKASIYQEFFSDWIQPWLHYIPLSSSYREIYNIHAFFSGATDSTLAAANSTSLTDLSASQRQSLDGDRRLRRIARAGKQWKKTMGRQVDMEAYVYRLCLEYARLWADDREKMSY